MVHHVNWKGTRINYGNDNLNFITLDYYHFVLNFVMNILTNHS